MANAYKLYKICPQCGGHGHLHKTSSTEGIPSEASEDCPACDGAKVVLFGYCTEAIVDAVDVPEETP